MSKAIKVLMVEDSEEDAQLAIRMLRRGGFDVQHERVDGAAAMQAALQRQAWDAVISDFRLPGFSGLDALGIVQSAGIDIPFILISGTIGEELAVEIMRAGASDYVMKQNLARLAPALERGLAEAAARESHRQAQRDLVESESLKGAILEASLDCLVTIDHEGNIVEFNPAAEATFGFRRDQVLGKSMVDQIIPPRLREAHRRGFSRYLTTGEGPILGKRLELEAMRADGSEFPIELAVTAIRSGATPLFTGCIRDITKRKQSEEELNRFRLAMDSSADMILISDRATLRHVDVNLTACKLLGYTRQELLQLGPPEILPVSRQDLEKTYDELVADPARASGMRSYYRCKDGSHLPFESTRRVVRSGDTWLIVAISRDIRERLAAEQALRQSEAGLRRAQEMAKLAHVITGPGGAFETWSDTLPQLIGVEAGQVPSSTRDWLDLLDPEDRPMLRAKAIEADATGARTKVKYRLRRADGAWIHVRQTMDPLRGDGDAEGRRRWFNTIQDVSDQKEAEERIERLNRVYAVLSGINGLIVRVRDREELFRDACRLAVEAGKFRLAWIGMVDRTAMRLKPVAWHGGAAQGYLDLMPLDLNPEAGQGYGLAGQAVTQRQAIAVDDMATDQRVLLRDAALQRNFHSLAMLPLLVAGEVAGVLALYASETGFFDEDEMKLLNELAGDISFALQHIQKAEKLDYLAYYDELTGLANRKLFLERVAQKLVAAGNSKSKVAVFALDVERFKTINEALGRQAGDDLLKQIADRFRKAGGDDSRLARLGADHFAVVAAEAQNEEQLARSTELRLTEFFGPPFRLGESEVRVAAKVGIAVFPDDGANAETLLQNAEAAVKKAKAGGDRYLFYTQQMTERIADRLSLESKLRQALEKDEFVLHYQPKVDVAARGIVGVEALIRWQNPERGLVPPAHFIPLLEETGLILQVGAWALKRAARDHRAWVEQGLKAPRVAVNVSPIQLRQRDFVEVVKQAISDGVAPTGIDLEITESLIMEDIKGNIGKLEAVRALGLNIAIDDFGTGYSSLGYLAKLPVQSLKIDRSFIIAMNSDPNAMTLVSTIISLAHSLRLKVVAEGVETEEQATILRLLRCEEMQGYLFSKPVPQDKLLELLRT